MTIVGKSVESKRREYKPLDTLVLFVGESPPANGTFFYCGDSNLARYTRESFEAAFDELGGASQFLEAFRDKGFYLVDLCRDRVNGLSKRERRAARECGIASLVATIHELKPRVIIVVMKAIERYVAQAAEDARLTGCPRYVLPFPAQGHQREYVAQLTELLRRLEKTQASVDAC